MAYSRPIASNMKSLHKTQIVTLFILSEQLFKLSSTSSHTDVQPSTPHGRLPRWWHTRWDHATVRRH